MFGIGALNGGAGLMTGVSERSIRLTGEEVRAILEGRKTQTRRVVKPQPEVGSGVAAADDWRDGTD